MTAMCRSLGSGLSGVNGKRCMQGAMDVCSSTPGCQGFQYCFLTPGVTGNAAERVRLKGGSAGALNVSNAVYNPYCRCEKAFSSALIAFQFADTASCQQYSQRHQLCWEGGGNTEANCRKSVFNQAAAGISPGCWLS